MSDHHAILSSSFKPTTGLYLLIFHSFLNHTWFRHFTIKWKLYNESVMCKKIYNKHPKQFSPKIELLLFTKGATAYSTSYLMYFAFYCKNSKLTAIVLILTQKSLIQKLLNIAWWPVLYTVHKKTNKSSLC